MKIMVGINTLTSVDRLAYANHMQFWFRMGRNHPDIEFAINTPNRASIDRMRNFTAKIALDNDMDYVMFIDDDVLIPVDALAKLLRADADIAGGWTIIRGYPYENMFFKYNDEKKEQLGYYKTEDIKPEENGLIDVDALGFSCVLIKCSLLKRINAPWFVTGPRSTEDVYFCIKAKKFVPECKIVIDTTLKTAHILGSEVIEPDNRDSYADFFKRSYPELCNGNRIDDRGDNYLKMIKDPTAENVKEYYVKGA